MRPESMVFSSTVSKKSFIGEIVKEGFLKIKLKTWHNYWGILKYKHLSFYKTKGSTLRGNIILKDCTVGNTSVKKNCLALSVEGKVYYIATSSDTEKDEWVQAILKCAENEVEEFDEIIDEVNNDDTEQN